jgi:plastocyanin domain-containing protein
MEPARKYKGRLITVFVGPTLEVPREMPWILLKQPTRQIESAQEGFDEVVDEVLSLAH